MSFLVFDATGRLKVSSGASGTGTVGQIAKWVTSSELGDSSIAESGVEINISTAITAFTVRDSTQIAWRNSGGSIVAYLEHLDGNHLSISAAQNISFEIGGSQKVHLDSGGHLGIGAAVSNNLLGVRGSVGVGTNYCNIAAPGDSVIVEGQVGIGVSSPTGKVHSLATTEQLRLGYDVSNYNSFTVSSIGSLTIAATGTSPNIVVTPGGSGLFKVSTLTANGFVKTSSSDGRFSIDTNTYLTGNQTITLSGDASGSGATSIAVTLATVNANVGTFGTATQVATFTVNAKGLITAASNTAIAIASTAVTDFTEAAQDAIGAMVDASLVYTDATPLLSRAALTGDATAAQGSNALTLASVITAGGPIGSATVAPIITWDAKGRLTAVSSATITPNFANVLGGTAGSVMFSDGTKLTEDNANLFWDDTNNRLGIGTALPASPLQVGTTASTRNLQVGSTGIVTARFDNNAIVLPVILVNRGITAAGHGAGLSFQLESAGATGISAGYVSVISENTTFNGATADSSMALATALDGTVTERVRILSSGNVGIGTTAPAVALQVGGSANAQAVTLWTSSAQGGILIKDTAAAADSVQLAPNATGKGQLSLFSPGAGTPLRILIRAGGGASYILDGLGIGTSTVSAVLHVQDVTDPQVRIGFNSTNYNSFSVDSIGSLVIAATGTNPNIVVTPGGSGLFKVSTLTTNGYVKTSSGDGRFSVQAVPIPVADGGTATTTAFTAGSIVFAGASGVYSQDNANLFFDDSNNRLGVGTTSPLYRLHVTAGAADVEFSLGPNPAAAGALLLSWFNATTSSRIQSYGGILAMNPLGNNVAIGTSTAPSLLTVAGLINTKNYTVATLPGATRGDIAYVTDALAPAFLTVVVGGGAVVTPVFYNGAAWVAM